MPARIVPPHTRFTAEVTARGLAVPDVLRAELAAACRTPFTSEPVLYERVMRGCTVLDERGGSDAPDALWLRWEALLLAWQCCGEEVNRQAAAGRKRTQRNITAGWDMRPQPPATEPIIGLDDWMQSKRQAGKRDRT